jgi:hypothetical protein
MFLALSRHLGVSGRLCTEYPAPLSLCIYIYTCLLPLEEAGMPKSGQVNKGHRELPHRYIRVIRVVFYNARQSLHCLANAPEAHTWLSTERFVAIMRRGPGEIEKRRMLVLCYYLFLLYVDGTGWRTRRFLIPQHILRG